MHSDIRRLLSYRLAGAFAILTAGRTAAMADEAPTSEAGTALELQAPATRSRVIEVNPEALTLTGSGCPRVNGEPTWDIVPQGATNEGTSGSFSVYFGAFDLSIDAKRSFVSKNCQISIPLRSGTSKQFAVTRFVHTGYIDLQAGVTFRHIADYSFAGTAGEQFEATPLLRANEYVGPQRRDFVFDSESSVSDVVRARGWSDCGTEVYVILSSRMNLYNSMPLGAGVASMSRLDGLAEKFVVEVSERSCQ